MVHGKCTMAYIMIKTDSGWYKTQMYNGYMWYMRKCTLENVMYHEGVVRVYSVLVRIEKKAKIILSYTANFAL